MLKQKVADCDGLVSLLTDRIDAALLDAAPRLKVVSNYAVGFNNIDVAGRHRARRRRRQHARRADRRHRGHGVLPAHRAPPAALVEGHQYGQAGKWKTWEPLGHLGQDLAGRTLGVVGMGRIGYALAKRCQCGWDMTCCITTCTAARRPRPNSARSRSIWIRCWREADFVSVHTDLNDKTRGLFNRRTFQQDEADGGVRQHGARADRRSRRTWSRR